MTNMIPISSSKMTSQIPEKNTTGISNGRGSIDWNVFKAGGEDGGFFGWIFPTNDSTDSQDQEDLLSLPMMPPPPPTSLAPPSASLGGVGIEAGTAAVATDALPLDDIVLAPEEVNLLGVPLSPPPAPIASTAAIKVEPMDIVPPAVAPVTTSSTTTTKSKGKSKLKKRPLQEFTTTNKKKSPKAKNQQRSLSSGSGSSDNDHEDVDDLNVNTRDKKQLRRLKNLISVREFRKRKQQKHEENEKLLQQLEAENLDLKMRLKIGKEAIRQEMEEKKQIRHQMVQLLHQKACEKQIASFIDMYRTNYSDYGPKRQEKLHFHLSRIRELLLPTQVTKMCLYSVEHGSLSSTSLLEEEESQMDLWSILAKELDVTPQQEKQILQKKQCIGGLKQSLNHTLEILNQLEQATKEKNMALSQQIEDLQRILTPSQTSKFILWVKENPAFMYMLDRLVDETIRPPKSRTSTPMSVASNSSTNTTPTSSR